MYYFIYKNICGELQEKVNYSTGPKNWLGSSYICPYDYELDHNFDDTELKNNQTTHPTIKFFVKTCCVNLEIMVW